MTPLTSALITALVLVAIYALIRRRMLKECGDARMESGETIISLQLEINQLKEDREKLLDAANDGGFWPDVSMERALGREVV